MKIEKIKSLFYSAGNSADLFDSDYIINEEIYSSNIKIGKGYLLAMGDLISGNVIVGVNGDTIFVEKKDREDPTLHHCMKWNSKNSQIYFGNFYKKEWDPFPVNEGNIIDGDEKMSRELVLLGFVGGFYKQTSHLSETLLMSVRCMGGYSKTQYFQKYAGRHMTRKSLSKRTIQQTYVD